MSEKMECPGCGSYTSSVLMAYHEDRPCPVCGLSSDSAAELLRVRKSVADEKLRGQYETAVKERDQAQRELAWAKIRLSGVEYELSRLLERVRSPLEKERRDDW